MRGGGWGKFSVVLSSKMGADEGISRSGRGALRSEVVACSIHSASDTDALDAALAQLVEQLIRNE